MPAPILDTSQSKDVIDLYRSGLSCREIANLFGVSQDCIRGRIRRAGIMRTNKEAKAVLIAKGWQPNRQPRTMPYNAIVDCYRSGMNCSEIGRKFDRWVDISYWHLKLE